MPALKTISKAAALLAFCVAAGFVAPPSEAECPLRMQNDTGYPIIRCLDGRPLAAYAYQPGAAIPTNTGNVDIACEADLGMPPCVTMPGTNRIGDSRVGIGAYWSTPGINGCPTGRVYISLQCNDGRGALLSISGGCSPLGYDVEAAYSTNEDASNVFLDVGAGTQQWNGRPRILNFTRIGGMDLFDVQVDPPFVQSDCSPGSLAQLYSAFGYCSNDTELNCAGMVPPSRGNLYSFTGPCTAADERPSIRDKAAWTPWTLDAAGKSVLSLPTPAAGQCNYLGTTTVVGGQESPFITGYVVTSVPNAASPRAESVRATRKGSSVEVTFSTASELGLAGFNVLAYGRAKGNEIRLNQSLVASSGVGGAGASYDLLFATADFRGRRSVVIESVLTNGTTLRTEPVDLER